MTKKLVSDYLQMYYRQFVKSTIFQLKLLELPTSEDVF